MKVDAETSRYQEDANARRDFTRDEITKARYLLRRLRFLETSIEQKGGMLSGASNGGGVHAEIELQSLEWILGPDGIAFITIEEEA